MDKIIIGQVRTWEADSNNEHFIILKNHGVHYGLQYWIIQYLTDGRKQTKTEEDFKKSKICDTNDRLYKYWFSCDQSDGGIDVNYVKVGESWLPYSEVTIREHDLINFEDAILIIVSDEELSTKYSEYTLMEMEENRGLFN